jgi:hypothetical protein
MTDGEGLYETEACKLLREFSIKNDNLLTFAVGFGNNFRESSLKNIVEAGNTKNKWYTFNLVDHKPQDCMI